MKRMDYFMMAVLSKYAIDCIERAVGSYQLPVSGYRGIQNVVSHLQ
jgi:hypothetical protein